MEQRIVWVQKVIGKFKFIPILPICLGLGVGLGALTNNVGVGMVIGVAMGTTLGLAADSIIYRQE